MVLDLLLLKEVTFLPIVRTAINQPTRIAIRTIAALCIVAVFFFATLYALDLLDPNVVRKRNAQAIIGALERYYAAKGTYPVLPARDSYVPELAAPLVSGGFISAIPSDPPGLEPTRYYSYDGKSFGLLLHFKDYPPCKIAMRDPGKGWWGSDIAYCERIGSFGW
jgi:hypothetical protein